MSDPMQDEIPDLEADDSSFGPAMRGLNPRQRKFVMACQMIGSTNNKRAAILAGYAENNAAVQGYRLAHDPQVQVAMLEEAGKRAGGLRFRALDVLRDLVDSVKTKPALRMRAALAILDRTGMPAMTEHNVRVEHEVGPQAAMIAKLKNLIRLNPKYIEMVPPQVRALLEPPKEVVDAEFVEVGRDPDADLLGE